MESRLVELFEDEALELRIRNKLPHLFHIAEIENKRGGRIGMEVGNLREKILIALLIYKFGEENVDAEIPTTERGVDVNLFGQPVSIKTITKKRITEFGGVKADWTVDAVMAHKFRESYVPSCDALLARIVWNATGGLFCIPLEAQQKVLSKLGREGFLKLPKPGTNPRGVEWSAEALRLLLNDTATRSLEIFWKLSSIEYSPYKRWVDYWGEEDK